MKRFAAALLGLAVLVGLTFPATSTGSEAHDILEFDVMAGVSEPFTGAANPIRGVNGGGLPWEIDEGVGELRENGRLRVEVEGLVLARRAPVPEDLRGTNPVPEFMAIVSCLTSSGGIAQTVNISTNPVPATPRGDARIRASVSLPTPCFAPIVFVTSPGGAWFAVTGR
ncbi:MAG: hypothetical protein ACRDJ2_07795 [Actinomycetota bacterium]